jgi:diadenosine tetraphosphate (Ap4A) HIT family hydrolase
MDCAFCDAAQVTDRMIVENDLARAFPTNAPIVRGHTLITPKRHVTYHEDLTDAERNAIEELRMRLHTVMKKVFCAEGFNYAWNEEKIGGQSVPHFHLHMLPRKEGDAGVYQYEPREFIYRPIPVDQRPISGEDELEEAAKTLRDILTAE